MPGLSLIQRGDKSRPSWLTKKCPSRCSSSSGPVFNVTQWTWVYISWDGGGILGYPETTQWRTLWLWWKAGFFFWFCFVRRTNKADHVVSVVAVFKCKILLWVLVWDIFRYEVHCLSEKPARPRAFERSWSCTGNLLGVLASPDRELRQMNVSCFQPWTKMLLSIQVGKKREEGRGSVINKK